MSRAQRLTFLAIAAVIAVVAVVLITRGDATTDTADSPTPTPSATASQQEASPGEATSTPTPTATPEPVKTLQGGKVTKLTVTQGQRVRFKATADQAEEIHVHGYDLMKDIEAPGDTVTFDFKATITGVFEIEYENAGEQIGQLSVEPK